MTDAALLGGIGVAVVIAILCAWLALRRGAALRRAEIERNVMVGLIEPDSVRGVAAALQAIATGFHSPRVILCVGDATTEHGVRAAHVADTPEPLIGIDLDDTMTGATEALASGDAIVLGSGDADPRITRFAAANEIGTGIIAGVGGEAAARGVLAVAGARRRDLALVRRLAERLGVGLVAGAPLATALDAAVTDHRRVRSRALHDPLTDLPTRALFMETLEDALAAREPGHPLGVVMVRLGGLLAAIERLGPLAGAAVLGEVGDRMRSLMRRSDFAARIGESEFALLLPDLRDGAEAIAVAERLRSGLDRPVVVGDVALDTHASIGIRVVGGAEEATAPPVMRDAAAATTRAQTSSGGYCLFNRDLAAHDTAQLIDDLREAIAHEELTLDYQPIINLDDGSVLGAEALVRWAHPTRGPVAPNDFLPLADEAGLAVDIGIWVLTSACRQVRAWQMEFPREPKLAISINIARAHLVDPGFADSVLGVIDAAGVDPDCVILEFSEDVLMSALGQAPARLDVLQRAGVHLAVDDVGTGHATLEYLRDLPVDILKIGRPFIAAIADGDAATSTAHAIVEQGERLKMSLVAEGVETALQVTLLRGLGCVVAQGFHLSRPLSLDAMHNLLTTGSVVLDAAPLAAGSLVAPPR